MEKYLFLVTAVVSLLSCKKDSEPLNLIGEWELRTSINGMTGERTDFPANNGKILKFSDSSYESYSSGQVIKSGSYKTKFDTTITTKELAERIIYDNEPNELKFFFRIESNKLTIWMDGYDTPAIGYERINR